MRLWDYRLFEYLPDMQIRGQWSELNSIFKNQNKHILINFVYKYEKVDLLVYTQWLLQEMEKRGFKFDLKNYYEYFKDLDQDDLDIHTAWITASKNPLFTDDMRYDYLKICCWNLYEKLIRGQKGFTEEAKCFIYKICFGPNLGE